MKVRITWNAGFGYDVTPEMEASYTLHGMSKSASADYDLALPDDPITALEALFEASNLYSGPLWAEMERQGLPSTRTHTALSVGDVVTLAGREWLCSRFGWTSQEVVS